MNTISLNVSLGNRSYPIFIDDCFDILAKLPDVPGRALLISDTHVGPLYADACQSALEDAGWQVSQATVRAGESSKSLQVAGDLYAAAADAGLDRASTIVALGGGVIGDLAGFVAATYLRGMKLIQIPTSLLAMVDSSVGGKTAVNIDAGKNLVGCFHQPSGVAINLNTLLTLPNREYRSGLAEVLKYGLIFDVGFYHALCSDTGSLMKQSSSRLPRVVARCCELKADVVARDERESGPRALLNFGHTLGHAVEACAGYGRYLHGEAVSIGMVYAARISQQRHQISADDLTALEHTLKDLDLPIRLPAGTLDWSAVRQSMQRDKKTAGGKPRLILLDAIGTARAGCTVEESELIEAWNYIQLKETTS